MQSDKLKHLPAVITEPELLPPDRVFHVAGRNWSSMNVRRMVCLEGGTVREILIEVLRRSLGNEPTAFQVSVWLDRCRCKVDGVEIAAEMWTTFKPQAGSFVEFLVFPRQGRGRQKRVVIRAHGGCYGGLGVYSWCRDRSGSRTARS